MQTPPKGESFAILVPARSGWREFQDSCIAGPRPKCQNGAMKTSLSCACALVVLLLAGCQTAGPANNTWRRPGYFGAPKRSVAVAVLAYRNDARAQYENALVNALHARGVDA